MTFRCRQMKKRTHRSSAPTRSSAEDSTPKIKKQKTEDTSAATARTEELVLMLEAMAEQLTPLLEEGLHHQLFHAWPALPSACRPNTCSAPIQTRLFVIRPMLPNMVMMQEPQ